MSGWGKGKRRGRSALARVLCKRAVEQRVEISLGLLACSGHLRARPRTRAGTELAICTSVVYPVVCTALAASPQAGGRTGPDKRRKFYESIRPAWWLAPGRYICTYVGMYVCMCLGSAQIHPTSSFRASRLPTLNCTEQSHPNCLARRRAALFPPLRCSVLRAWRPMALLARPQVTRPLGTHASRVEGGGGGEPPRARPHAASLGT
ncbi:hypothetical protein BDY21DRAFT_356812 [Lineolata rhizophorae]|uniref:Uncharacterized protein n=1 Tax=Lineolata rhizophorae TaxID=578093 RepID=A0A6A6NP65_9PEZI|nr:hypothetical protein BDY21DRAFT_356812 [Lineolata rhizophorae]